MSGLPTETLPANYAALKKWFEETYRAPFGVMSLDSIWRFGRAGTEKAKAAIAAFVAAHPGVDIETLFTGTHDAGTESSYAALGRMLPDQEIDNRSSGPLRDSWEVLQRAKTKGLDWSGTLCVTTIESNGALDPVELAKRVALGEHRAQVHAYGRVHTDLMLYATIVGMDTSYLSGGLQGWLDNQPTQGL